MTEEIKEINDNELSEGLKESRESVTADTEAFPSEPERFVVFEEALEAILFAAGHPVTYSTLGRVFDMTSAKIKEKVYEYASVYNDSKIPRGVIMLAFSDSCQLCTKQYYLTEIRNALGIKKSGSLSTSSMEALAIIAYNQPVTRAFVDTLRRVDSSYAMNNLIDRGLITSVGRLDVPGRPMLYATTSDFLRSFGLSDLSELPKTSDELISAFNNAKTDSDGNDEIEGQISADIDAVIASSANSDNDKDGNTSDNHDISDFEPSADDDVNID